MAVWQSAQYYCLQPALLIGESDVAGTFFLGVTPSNILTEQRERERERERENTPEDPSLQGLTLSGT